MAFLTKLASSALDDAQAPPHTSWYLYVAQEEIAGLAAGADVGFVVSIPKDTPLFDTVARVILKRMPAELADRHRIAREFEGEPDVVAAKVLEATKARLEELVTITGSDVADGVAAAHKAKGGKK